MSEDLIRCDDCFIYNGAPEKELDLMSVLELLMNAIFVLGSVKQCDACFRISKNYRWGACKTSIMLFYLLILLLILKQISCSFINSKIDISRLIF